MTKYRLLEPLKHDSVFIPCDGVVEITDDEAAALASIIRRAFAPALESAEVTAEWPAASKALARRGKAPAKSAGGES